jgi:alpha-D-xyloside xylohydrolase
MGFFERDKAMIVWRENQETLWIGPCGANGLRVRSNLCGGLLDLPNALVEEAAGVGTGASIQVNAEHATIRNGAIQATVSANGRLSFSDSEGGEEFLSEPDRWYHEPPNRHFVPQAGAARRIEARFRAIEGERLYGLGQHQHGRLDQKGCVIELHQRNTEVAIPFLVSSRGYGFLWNNPGVGRVELGGTMTRWVSDASRQLDYCVIRGKDYADILSHYADLTGHCPPFPEWAAGFWQCKLRYETQEELLTVAREFWKRGLPLSVIVSDFFHWTRMGDWRFDPACWPDPSSMVSELAEHGARLMVSIWPTVSPLSENFTEMRERGFLINNELGVDAQHVFVDNGTPGPAYFSYYDATDPAARLFIWEAMKKGYYKHGVKLWWLDNDEPDINPWDPRNLRFRLGNGAEVANIYPLLHQKAFYDGMKAEGETEIITLSRSAWAGSQRYGAAVWSGDIASSFPALQAQVRAGLNAGMSGVCWWTSDIGGFHGGDISSPSFRELVIRWFQFGVFCPLFRLHGHRMPVTGALPASGAPNEPWSFGEEAYRIIRGLLFLRERLRPYIMDQMEKATATGLPPMRPLFVDFPVDPACQTVDDQFLFGPDILVSPILFEGAREREVVLPRGVTWTDAWTGACQEGGRKILVKAPLDRIPVFIRSGAAVRTAFSTGGEKD